MIPVLEKKRECPAGGCIPATGRPLPTFYMNDYSVLGFLVYPWEEAIRLLEEKGFSVIRGAAGVEVAIEGPAHVQEIVATLTSYGIDIELADVVGGVYQG